MLAISDKTVYFQKATARIAEKINKNFSWRGCSGMENFPEKPVKFNDKKFKSRSDNTGILNKKDCGIVDIKNETGIPKEYIEK